MPIDARTLSPWEQIYTYVNPQGVNTHIHANRLREYLTKKQPKLMPKYMRLTPVDVGMAKRFLAKNIVSYARVTEMIRRCATDPIIYCEDGTYEANGRPNVMLVDGHHRYVAAALCSAPAIPAWIIPPLIWHRFEIINYPDVTREGLEAMPISPRSY